MRNLLVTGGAGFIGGNFVHYWLREHPDDRVVVLDALTYAGNLATLAGLEVDRPVHLRARRHRRRRSRRARLIAEHDDRHDRPLCRGVARRPVDRRAGRRSCGRTSSARRSLLDAARRAWRTAECVARSGVRFHHVSTDEVYGSLGPNDPPFTEQTTPYSPNSPYAASKAASDHLVRAYHHTYGLPVDDQQLLEQLRPVSVSGKADSADDRQRAERQSRSRCTATARQVRDWLFVEDHCDAIDRILQADVGGLHVQRRRTRRARERAHRGSDLCADRRAVQGERRAEGAVPGVSRELAAELRGADHARARSPGPRSPLRDRSERHLVAACASSPAKRCKPDWPEPIDWYLQNEAWWRAVMDGSYRRWIEQQYGA